jgi:hypothetical protein
MSNNKVVHLLQKSIALQTPKQCFFVSNPMLSIQRGIGFPGRSGLSGV